MPTTPNQKEKKKERLDTQPTHKPETKRKKREDRYFAHDPETNGGKKDWNQASNPQPISLDASWSLDHTVPSV